MNNAYSQDNTAGREQLIALVHRLTEAEPSHPLEAGWTVAGILAHLAFWDQRAIILLQKWQKDGIGPSSVDADVINEAMRGLCIALPPRVAAQLAIDYATAVDQAIELLDTAMITNVEISGTTVRLNRSLHRREHMREIIQSLGLR